MASNMSFKGQRFRSECLEFGKSAQRMEVSLCKDVFCL